MHTGINKNVIIVTLLHTILRKGNLGPLTTFEFSSIQLSELA